MAILNRPVTVGVFNPATNGARTYLDVLGVVVRFDERSIPMLTYDITIASPPPGVEALLAPASGNYVEVISNYVEDPAFKRLKAWHGLLAGTTRNGDGTMRVLAVSADTRLIEYTPTADDIGCKSLQSDVRLIWRYVLSKVFGPLNTGWIEVTQATSDGTGVPLTPFPTYRDQTNLAPNGGFEYGTTGWTASQSTMSAVTTQKHGGAYSLQITPSTSLNTSRATTALNLSPGVKYTLSAWVRQSAVMGSSANAQRCTIKVSANVSSVVQDLVTSTPAPNVANQWNRVVMTFTMPSLADAGSVVVQLLNGTPNSAAVTTWWDDLMIVEGDGLDTDGVTVIPYFDGDTTDGTAGYNYDWQGTVGNSSSTRTALIDRDPDVLTWKAGQTAYDFLRPIMEAFGYRSIVGEGLLPPPSNVGALPIFTFVTSLYAGNSTGIAQIAEGNDLYSLDTGQSRSDTFADGTPLFADAVIIRYTWVDSLGVEQTAIDAYAPAGYVKPYYLELEEPYPGPGRAQSLLSRLIARRSTYTVTCRLRLSAQPGKQVSITSGRLLSAPVLGQVDTVEHDLIAGTTTLVTKNTVAYPTAAWLRLPAGESWNSSPTGASWTAETLT